MYLFIPIALFLLSILVIFYIVRQKFVYLKKLTPEAISSTASSSSTFWSGLFPEVFDAIGKINWREYKLKITGESEKLLRRMRLIFLRIESMMHNFSLKLRLSTKKQEETIVKEEEKQVITPVSPAFVIDPKEEEQHLIMEIAKNPKDATLYQKLGDIYLKTGEKDNARMSFKTVLDLDPENWYAKKKLADLA